MLNNSEYVIQYSGLKLGVHSYGFKIGKAFFEAFEYEEISNCYVEVSLRLEKSASMLVLYFDINGTSEAQCDRCLEPINVKVEGSYRQLVKISDYAEDAQDDEIVVLPSAEYEINVSKFIFDFILLSYPNKTVHDEGECNEEVIEKLNNYLLTEEKFEDDSQEDSENSDDDEIDPRWKALEALKKKN